MKTLIALLALLAIAGCEPTEDSIQRSKAEPITYKSSGRFKVDRVGVFYDALSYNEKRGIYVITDTETNQEFVGVSGVGISELAAHQVGKTRRSDER
ncbi:hypothetical protein [Pseudomonas sp. SDO52101_S400]